MVRHTAMGVRHIKRDAVEAEQVNVVQVSLSHPARKSGTCGVRGK